MRILVSSVLVLAAVAAAQHRLLAQSPRFSLKVDFRPAPIVNTPATLPQSRWVGRNPQPAAGAIQPMDCAMVRDAERNLDTKIVKAPPSNVKHALRVVEAAPCAKK